MLNEKFNKMLNRSILLVIFNETHKIYKENTILIFDCYIVRQSSGGERGNKALVQKKKKVPFFLCLMIV